MPETLPCGLCGRPILWHLSETGNVLALDPEPVSGGSVVILAGLAVTVSSAGEWREQMLPAAPRYRYHCETCQQPQSKSKRRASPKPKE